MKCLDSKSELVRYVPQYSIFHGHMSSILGCNVRYCCKRFSVLPNGAVFSAISINHVCKNR